MIALWILGYVASVAALLLCGVFIGGGFGALAELWELITRKHR